MEPYYQDDWVAIYHGDCRDVVPMLQFDLIITDPPYGVNHPTGYRGRGRGNITNARDYPPVYGDDEPFDPSWLLQHEKPTCLWGANYYAQSLPRSSGWLVWDKQRPPNLDQATCELAWTNFVKGVRLFRYLWNGAMRQGQEALVHPTQKPEALTAWILSLRWTPDGIVLDPYMGSGSALMACKNARRPAVGIEIEERYCEIAAERCSQEVLPL